MNTRTSQDFTAITELPGGLVTAEQRARLCQRYALASEHAAGRRTLEVACGAGLGLGAVAETAGWLAGGDYTAAVLDIAQAHYRGAVPLTRFDAQRLPFRCAAFDLILCFEAIYYFPEPALFLAGCRRVLSDGGLLLIGSENKAWAHFAAGPLSAAYFSAPELHALLAAAGFERIELFGSFAAGAYTAAQQARAGLRRAITASGIFQRWPQARERLKPLVYRGAATVGYDLCRAEHRLPPLVALDPRAPHPEYKVIYALASSGANDEQ
jgi:ubiquinone/menaquinone biosynthesis C-methylase UbiE